MQKLVKVDQIDALVWSICILLPHTPKPIGSQVTNDWCIRCLKCYSGNQILRKEINHLQYMLDKEKSDQQLEEKSELHQLQEQRIAVAKQQLQQSLDEIQKRKLDDNKTNVPSKKRVRRVGNKMSSEILQHYQNYQQATDCTTSNKVKSASGNSGKDNQFDPKNVRTRMGNRSGSESGIGKNLKSISTDANYKTRSRTGVAMSTSVNSIKTRSRGDVRSLNKIPQPPSYNNSITSNNQLKTEEIKEVELIACSINRGEKAKRIQDITQSSKENIIPLPRNPSTQDDFIDIM